MTTAQDLAARELMILLYGSLKEAERVGEALMRLTPEDTEAIKAYYQRSRDTADEVAREYDFSRHPLLAGEFVNESPPSMSAEEERKFNAFMEEIYARVERES